MKTLRFIGIFTASIALAASLLADSVKVKKEDMPQAVVNTVEKMAPGYTFGSAIKNTKENGKVGYEVNVSKPGKDLRLSISSEGKWSEIREGGPKMFEEAPAPVRKRIETASGGTEPDFLRQLTHPGKSPFYKFATTRSIAADGTVSAEENLGQIAKVKNQDVPLPIRTTVAKLAAESDWWAVKLNGKQAKYLDAYEVRIDKLKKYFIYSPDGQLLETWDVAIKFADVPAPVAKEIRRRTQGLDPHYVFKVTPSQGATFYTFRILDNLALDGSVLPEEDDD